jgi:hypothetical protein
MLSLSFADSFSFAVTTTSVGDPNQDPQDPHVFGPPGSGPSLFLTVCERTEIMLAK